ncbi:hypothetical protein BGZ50_000120 [Haplosporangium sp. Z 11]|nr:hypothetical protein BGZ50_000120 [Haplosporangium sp. Z 11]
MAVLRRDSAVAISGTDLDFAVQASHETPMSFHTKDLSLNGLEITPTTTTTTTGKQELNALDDLALNDDETDSKVNSIASDKKKMKKKKAKPSVAQKQTSDGPNSSSSGTLDHQHEPLTKESLAWLESAVVRGDTKSTGKKNKASRNKAKKVNTKNTDPPQKSNRAMSIEHDVHSEEEKEGKKERNEYEKEEEYQDFGESQDVCEDHIPNNTSQFDFLECDFFDNGGGQSNWADDVDEYDQQNNASQTTFTMPSPDPQELSSHSIDAHVPQEADIAKALVSVKVIPKHSQDARLYDDASSNVRRGQRQDSWQTDRSRTETYSDHTVLRFRNQRWHQGPHSNDFAQHHRYHHHHHSAQPPYHERQRQPCQPRHNQSAARNHQLSHHHEQDPRQYGSYQRLPRPNIHTERSGYRSHPPSIPPWQSPSGTQVQSFNGVVKNQRSARNFHGKGSPHPLQPRSFTDSPYQEQRQPPCPSVTPLLGLDDITKTKVSPLSIPPPLQPTIFTTEAWEDREKIAKLLTSRWDIAMASVGNGPDAATVYYSSE